MPCIALAEGVVKKTSKKKKHEMAEGQNVEQQTAVEVEQVVEQKNEDWKSFWRNESFKTRKNFNRN